MSKRYSPVVSVQSHSLIAWVALLAILPLSVSAATRISELVFDGCFYGNRGGMCVLRDAENKEHAIQMPVRQGCERGRPNWFIDGTKLRYTRVDGDFCVPDHPTFADDHGSKVDDRQHPFKGCKVRMIEESGAKKRDDMSIYIDTSRCGQ